MKRLFSCKQAILRFLADGEFYKPHHIASSIGVSRPSANKYLAELVIEWKIIKEGKSPHVTYHITSSLYIPENVSYGKTMEHHFSYDEVGLLDQHFLKYDVDGSELIGTEGFLYRCQQRNLDPYQKYTNFALLITTLTKLRNSCGLLDATQEFAKHVDLQALDAVYYGDQYKLNEFGRSKLAEMWFFGKQLQYEPLLNKVIVSVLRKLECLIKTENIDALAFTPPSIKRNIQILTLLDHALGHIVLPRVVLVKDSPTAIIIPQKSLKKREDRILNARKSIYINDKNVSQYKKILLIDDFVGSGATLNETAKKLKFAWVQKVIGFAIVGNLDMSYEVINEM